MSEHPKREDYDSEGDFLDAMAKHYGIDPRMIRPLSESDQLRADIGRLNFEIRILEKHIKCLTKAGDAMAKTIGENGVHDNGSFLDVAFSIDAWYAAKEGKQP